MERLTMERDEYPVDGMFHSGIVYRVKGMPEGQRATIESENAARSSYQVRRWVDFAGFRYLGEYPSPETALAGLQEQIDFERATVQSPPK